MWSFRFLYAAIAGDCDDNTSGVNPGAAEACNGVDDDCDGETDEPGNAGCSTYYLDQDGDSYGLDTSSQCLCEESGSFTAGNSLDCYDQN